jgi:hypothetical protein
LDALNKKCVASAEKHGYVETMVDRSVGGSKGYPLLCARGEWGKVLPTVPLNYRTQGTAGQWMKKAMARCEEQLREWRRRKFDGWMVLTVHDELIFDFPVARPGRDGRPGNAWRADVLRKLMERGGDDVGVPTPVSVEYHRNSWSEGERV